MTISVSTNEGILHKYSAGKAILGAAVKGVLQIISSVASTLPTPSKAILA